MVLYFCFADYIFQNYFFLLNILCMFSLFVHIFIFLPVFLYAYVIFIFSWNEYFSSFQSLFNCNLIFVDFFWLWLAISKIHSISFFSTIIYKGYICLLLYWDFLLCLMWSFFIVMFTDGSLYNLHYINVSLCICNQVLMLIKSYIHLSNMYISYTLIFMIYIFSI